MSKRKIKTPGVYHGANGTYYLKYNNKTYRGFETVEDAEIKKAQLTLYGDKKPRTTIRLNDVALDFLYHEMQRYKNEEIKYGTYSKKEQLYRIHIKELLGFVRMDKLSLKELRNYRSEIGAKDLSTRQKNYIIQVTVEIINHGTRYFEIKNNNSIELKSFRATRNESRKKLDDVRNVLNDDQFRLFISSVDEVDFHYLFTFLYLTGARLGEALALTWKDVEGNKINIYQTLTSKTSKRGTELINTKTVSSDRVISISKSFQEELELYKSYKSTLYGFSDKWFVFGAKKPLSTTTIDRKKLAAIEASGVKYFTNHQLRHSFVTNAFNRGEQLISIGSYIGHKNIAETMRTYAHLSSESSKEFDNYINKSSQNLLTGVFSKRKPTV